MFLKQKLPKWHGILKILQSESLPTYMHYLTLTRQCLTGQANAHIQKVNKWESGIFYLRWLWLCFMIMKVMSHRYREVTGSNPVEVLNFFQASLRNCI